MKRDNHINVVFLAEAREAYMAPVVEMVEVRVEKGFGDSDITNPGSDSGQEEGKGYTW